MNWTDSHRRVDKDVIVGNCRMNSLLFAYELLLHAWTLLRRSMNCYCMHGSSQQGLQLTFDRFYDACDQEGTKISSKNLRYYVLAQGSVSWADAQGSVSCK